MTKPRIITPHGVEATTPDPEQERKIQGIPIQPLAFVNVRCVATLAEFLTGKTIGTPLALEAGSLIVAIPLPHSLQIVQALQLEQLRAKTAADAAGKIAGRPS